MDFLYTPIIADAPFIEAPLLDRGTPVLADPGQDALPQRAANKIYIPYNASHLFFGILPSSFVALSSRWGELHLVSKLCVVAQRLAHHDMVSQHRGLFLHSWQIIHAVNIVYLYELAFCFGVLGVQCCRGCSKIGFAL